MRLGEMTWKNVLKADYNSDKTVAFCGFAKIQRQISRIVDSITKFILFKFRQ